MRIAIMGAGGVGGYFGARLALAGNDVTFIARGAHGETIAREGLTVKTMAGDIRVESAKAVQAPADAEPVDAVLFAVKMTDAVAAAEALKPLVQADTTVFCFQNGVEAAERLGPILGRDRIVPGVAQISATIGAPGVIIQAGGAARLIFGEADGRESDRTAAFHAACKAAQFDVSLSANIRRDLWLKFLMLAPLAAMTALTRSPLEAIRNNERTRDLLRALIEEVFALGQKMDVGYKQRDLERVIQTFDSLPGATRASMAFDLEHGKPLELPYLSGAVVRLADAHGIAAPAHGFICAALALQADGRKGSA